MSSIELRDTVLLKDTCKKLGIPEPDEVYVNPLRLAEDHCFGQHSPNGGYRKAAIRMCLNARTSFHSDTNTDAELMSSLISITCPKCKRKMKLNPSSGGSSESYTTGWHCDKCKISVSLTMPDDGIVVHFDNDD